jgi:cell shape-determining protein MreD
MLGVLIAVLRIVIPIVLAWIYLSFGWKFWSGFRQTNFTSGRILLTLLWPVCFIITPSYRRNFRKALRGQ